MKGEKEGSWCLWKLGMMEKEKERKKKRNKKKLGAKSRLLAVPKWVFGKEEKKMK